MARRVPSNHDCRVWDVVSCIYACLSMFLALCHPHRHHHALASLTNRLRRRCRCRLGHPTSRLRLRGTMTLAFTVAWVAHRATRRALKQMHRHRKCMEGYVCVRSVRTRTCVGHEANKIHVASTMYRKGPSSMRTSADGTRQ